MAAVEGSVRQLAQILRKCLAEGRAVHVERLGTFRPAPGGRFTFRPDPRPAVFLAYAVEDAPAVERIFDALADAGFAPWMDRRKLLPGQDWRRAIEGAIETADYFVACFSSISVRKRGSFQREVRLAMECAERAPVGEVFFIPVRLDECRLPEEIRRRWHYVDLFPFFDEGVKKLVQAIRKESRRRAA
ncbi:MAG: TIR domain-containing protein [Bryobacteraceae bacterium]|nr:TIR domain-containing protein [Bryobacteraceae bacterium]